MMVAARGLTIGRLAAQSGVNLETVRYYERIGLMPAPDRTAGGHRVYDQAHRRRLTFVRRGRELGFGIEAIRTLLALAEPGHRSCDDVLAVAGAHLREVRAKLADLARLEVILAQTVSACESHASAPACPVLEMLEAA
ncbi:MAG TPA: helix-turn-helix domain-containing protein [Caulobacteraceae bacterium]|nr:helix-turn-helix domain-containing protein [Caulobacteraceae bacterium]